MFYTLNCISCTKEIILDTKLKMCLLESTVCTLHGCLNPTFIGYVLLSYYLINFFGFCTSLTVKKRQYWQEVVLGILQCCNLFLLEIMHVPLSNLIKNIFIKKERERHLPGYCQQTSLELVDYDKKRLNIVAFSLHCGFHQLKRSSSFFIIIHELQRCLLTVAR